MDPGARDPWNGPLGSVASRGAREAIEPRGPLGSGGWPHPLSPTGLWAQRPSSVACTRYSRYSRVFPVFPVFPVLRSYPLYSLCSRYSRYSRYSLYHRGCTPWIQAVGLRGWGHPPEPNGLGPGARALHGEHGNTREYTGIHGKARRAVPLEFPYCFWIGKCRIRRLFQK